MGDENILTYEINSGSCSAIRVFDRPGKASANFKIDIRIQIVYCSDSYKMF